MKKTFALLCLCLIGMSLVAGCEKDVAAQGYDKKDFAKSGPPPGYMSSVPKGNGPASAPPAQPPAGK